MEKTGRTVIAALIFFAVITSFFYLLVVGVRSDYSPNMTMEKIEQSDLSSVLVPLGSSLCDWYPAQLYYPEDFEKTEPESGEGKAMYGTYRMLLPLPAGRTYGITGLSCSYAQRVYVNGVLLSEVGQVADNAEDFSARTDSYSIFFTPLTDTTEIIVQMAHWNNKNGYFNRVYLAEQEIIVANNRANFLAGGLIVGTLLAFAVFFFGMFLFYPDKRHLLWFALMCFCSGLYFFIFQNKDIMSLLPELPWAISHKLEYLSQFASFALLIVYVVSLTKLRITKWQKASFFILIGAVMFYYAVMPSSFYSYHQTLPICIYACAMVASMLYVLYRALKDRVLYKSENCIVIVSLLLGIGIYAFDIITNRNYNVMVFGTILTAFFSAIAITMKFARNESELDQAQLREREITESNVMLERMGELKNDLLHNISHEMKTPLTVMSGYAQLTDWQIKEGIVNEQTARNLRTISNEAERLSNMVNRLLAISFNKGTLLKKSKVDIAALLENAAAVCRPVLQRNGNSLELYAVDLPPVYANAESILQVLVNLTINAGKHTRDGIIRYTAAFDEEKAFFTVSDNGSGIAPELVPHIFEKGFSGDGSNGLGLAISQDIMRHNNGEIYLESTSGQGTSFVFTLPLWKEGEHEQAAFSRGQ